MPVQFYHIILIILCSCSSNVSSKGKFEGSVINNYTIFKTGWGGDNLSHILCIHCVLCMIAGK